MMPVYQYARENWAPPRYRAVVRHHGSMSPQDSNALEVLRGPALPARVNLTVEVLSTGTADPHGSGIPTTVELYAPANRVSLPATPLTLESATRLISSPLRTRIADDLRRGDAASWVLLTGGDGRLDSAAQECVEGMRHSLENMRERVLIHTVRRDDAAESVLVASLQAVAPDSTDQRQPMLFCIFGRGLVLPPLIGARITPERIVRYVRGLLGPCSCDMQDARPADGLLVAADWDHSPEEADALPSMANLYAAEQDLTPAADEGTGDSRSAERSVAPAQTSTTEAQHVGHQTTCPVAHDTRHTAVDSIAIPSTAGFPAPLTGGMLALAVLVLAAGAGTVVIQQKTRRGTPRSTTTEGES
jgi:hypothetical protein